MASLDTKMSLTLKDLIFLVTILGGMFGGYYTIAGEQDQLKKDVAALKEANKAYVGLPGDVEAIKEDMEKYGALTETIYYGLLSEGIIPPPK